LNQRSSYLAHPFTVHEAHNCSSIPDQQRQGRGLDSKKQLLSKGQPVTQPEKADTYHQSLIKQREPSTTQSGAGLLLLQIIPSSLSSTSFPSTVPTNLSKINQPKMHYPAKSSKTSASTTPASKAPPTRPSLHLHHLHPATRTRITVS